MGNARILVVDDDEAIDGSCGAPTMRSRQSPTGTRYPVATRSRSCARTSGAAGERPDLVEALATESAAHVRHAETVSASVAVAVPRSAAGLRRRRDEYHERPGLQPDSAHRG